jgi:exopolysaccharide production protein ExoQ
MFVAVLALASILPGILGLQYQGSLGGIDFTPLSDEGDPYKQAVMGCLYAVLLLIALPTFSFKNISALGWPLSALTFWCGLSISWSVLPDGSLRRELTLIATVLTGLYLGVKFDYRQMADRLSIIALLTLLICFAEATVAPHLGLDYDGKLRGLFSDKNTLGAFAGLSFVASLFSLSFNKNGPTRCLVYLLSLVCSTVTFWLSGSSTPVVAIGMSLVSGLCLFIMPGPVAIFSAAMPVIIATISVVLIYSSEYVRDVVGGLFGRDSTFSDRLSIWGFVISALSARPLTGFGFEAFWLGRSSPGALYWYDFGNGAIHSHNGFLQLASGAGLIACLLFLFSICDLIACATTLAKAGNPNALRWLVLFLTLFLIENLSESKLWEGNDLFTAVYVFTTVRTHLQARKISRRDDLKRIRRAQHVSFRQSY